MYFKHCCLFYWCNVGIDDRWMLLQELKKHKVRDVVRVCEPSYKIEELKNEGINVTDLEFDDGTPPPVQVRFIHHRLVPFVACLQYMPYSSPLSSSTE
jgi:hypothetical protein